MIVKLLVYYWLLCAIKDTRREVPFPPMKKPYQICPFMVLMLGILIIQSRPLLFARRHCTTATNTLCILIYNIMMLNPSVCCYLNRNSMLWPPLVMSLRDTIPSLNHLLVGKVETRNGAFYRQTRPRLVISESLCNNHVWIRHQDIEPHVTLWEPYLYHQ